MIRGREILCRLAATEAHHGAYGVGNENKIIMQDQMHAVSFGGQLKYVLLFVRARASVRLRAVASHCPTT